MYSKLIQYLNGFDQILTENYYSDQPTVHESCPCENCKYYEDVFLKKDLKLFSVLTDFGIDLRKEQYFDPSGITMVRNDDGEFLFCEAVYVLIGDFADFDDDGFDFEFSESSITISLNLHLEDEQTVLLFVDFELE